MSPAEFRHKLQARVDLADLTIAPNILGPLETYYRLLARWNRAINLTALPLDPLGDETIDRLFIEPLSAAAALPELPSSTWFDLGTGGGSPAVPLLLARPDLRLTMVEARERKAAFLREVVRTLRLDARVESLRFEDIAMAHRDDVGLVTARAVRLDEHLFGTARELLVTNGLLVLFSNEVVELPRGFQNLNQAPLAANTSAKLISMRRVPRGTR